MPRLHRPRSLLVSGVVATTILVASAGYASGVSPGDATPAQKKEAMSHFTAGKAAAESKSWEKAQTELRASLDVVDSPNARLLLARMLRDSGDLAGAWAEYGKTLDDAALLAAKEPRYQETVNAATTERGDLDAKLAFVTVVIAHAPPDATLKVGGRTIPPNQWSAPIFVPPGTTDVVIADAAGKELARKTVAATLGQKTPVELDAQPPPPPPAPAAPAAPSPDDVPPSDSAATAKDQVQTTSGGRSKLRPYSYVAGGVGVAGFAVFGIFGAMEKSTYHSLQSACPGNACPPDKSGDISSGKTQELVANVGLVVGIAGVAAGATLLVLSLGGSSPTAQPASSTSLVVAPNFIGLRGAL
jgi:hypothetical protein